MKRRLQLFLVLGLLIFNLTLLCSLNGNDDKKGLPVTLEIRVLVYNNFQMAYTIVPDVVINLYDLSRNEIQGNKFRGVADRKGIVIFETDTNVLNPTRTYLLVGDHPENINLIETEREFTMPKTPNLGNEFYVKYDFIIKSTND